MYVGNIPQRRTTKKCKEPCWNKVAKEQEQYDEKTIENVVSVNEGEYYCVLPDHLGAREKEIYDYAVDFLQDKIGQWISRPQVVEYVAGFTENIDAVRAHLKDICYKPNKSFKVNSETRQGLLFKKEQNSWFLRLNN